MNIINIQNYMDPALDIFTRLTEAELLHFYEPDIGLFIAESPKVIGRALDAGYEPVAVLAEDRYLEHPSTAEILSRMPDIPVFASSADVLCHMTGYTLTRGLLCAMRRKPLPAVSELCGSARRGAGLEDVMNPTNVGAIFRSAAALNIDAVLLTRGSSDPLYRRSARVSMGTVFQVPWTFLEKAQEPWPIALKALGFHTAAMALTPDAIPLNDPSLSVVERLVIALGTEGYGLREETLCLCDSHVIIPMSHGVDSLNVAAASAVAFWELGGRRS